MLIIPSVHWMINHLKIIIKYIRCKLFVQTLFHRVNPSMHNVPKWLDKLQKSCIKCGKIFKVCLTILGHYALKGQASWSNHLKIQLKYQVFTWGLKLEKLKIKIEKWNLILVADFSETWTIQELLRII